MSKLVSASEPFRSTNQYIVDVINLKKSTPLGIRDARIKPILDEIKSWAGDQLSEIFVSGSSAKGTALKGSSDLDLFVSLKANTTETLKEIFNSLNTRLNKKFTVRKQNVSVRVTYSGLQIDIVPGKKLPNQTHWHYLYTSRNPEQERTQTNVVTHVNTVINSGRVNEIIALKIWRDLNKLEFPSMYLEMYILKALAGKWTGKAYLANNFEYVIEHISKYFLSTAVYDPCNTSNTISNCLYKYEKEAIQQAALNSIKKAYLKQIIY